MEQEVRIKSGNTKLFGIIHYPKSQTRKAVIFSNGYPDEILEYHLPIAVTRALAKGGFVSLGFNTRGRWPSKGKFTKVGMLDEVSDLEAAIRFMHNKGFSRIGIAGHSLGGTSCALIDKKYVNAMVLLEPALDVKFLLKSWNTKEIQRQFKRSEFAVVDYSYILGRKRIAEIIKLKDISDEVSNLRVPTLFIGGSKNIVTPHLKKAYKIASSPKALRLIPHARHTFDDEDVEKKMLAYTVGWFKKWL